MKLNKNLYPPGGYVYTEKDGAVLQASDWRALYLKISEYRKRRGWPAGDAQQDVANQICATYPAYCYQPMSPQEREKHVSQPSLKSRVLRWLGRKVAEHNRIPLTYVSATESQGRAEVCRQCPKHTALKTSCASCLIALKAFRLELLGRNAADTSLGACSVLGVDLPTAVKLDELREANPDLPGNCWRKRTL